MYVIISYPHPFPMARSGLDRGGGDEVGEGCPK